MIGVRDGIGRVRGQDQVEDERVETTGELDAPVGPFISNQDGVDALTAVEERFGPGESEQAEDLAGSDSTCGLLASLCWSWRDIQQARLAAEQRGLALIATELLKTETRVAEQVRRELRRQPIWPWLSQFPGLRGVHVARLVALIGDPLRFPGQPCTEGHLSPARYAPGDPCPRRSRPDAEDAVAVCSGTMLEPRSHTGVRSLWHYLGLHVVEGKLPKKRKGQRVSWNPIGRTVCLQPGGIAEHIVRQRVPVYRDAYDVAKERLFRERGAAEPRDVDGPIGSLPDVAEIGQANAIGSVSGLRPIQIEARARTIAVKAFVADLLVEMKRLAGQVFESDCSGETEVAAVDQEDVLGRTRGRGSTPVAFG